MGLLLSTRRALLGISGIKYLLRAWMGGTTAQAYADAQVLDTPEGVLDGTLTVVEKDGTLSVNASGECAFTAQATPTWGDLGVYSQAITRALGRGLLGTHNVGATTTQALVGNWSNAASLGLAARRYSLLFGISATIFAQIQNAVENVAVGTYAASTDYDYAIVLGGYDADGVPWRQGEPAASYLYGASLFIRGGAYTDWTLPWRTALDNTSTLYANFSNRNANGTLEKFRVPDVDLKAVLQPTALSTFIAANGTDLATGYTPEVGGVWTERVGDWDIQGNAATPDDTARASATIESSISDAFASVATRNTATANTTARDNGLIFRESDADNYWYAGINSNGNQFRIVERNATVETIRASAAVAINAGQVYDIIVITDGQTIDAFLDGGNKITHTSAFNQAATRFGLRGRRSVDTHDNFHINARTSTIYDATLGAV